jgi:protein arginine kinase activator
MIACQECQSRPATVHVLDVLAEGGPKQHHLCPQCHDGQEAAAAFPALYQKVMADKAGRTGTQRCPECGITLRDFRQKGRLGCPRDYEVFGDHVRALLEKVHGATKHVGRGPGESGYEQARRELSALRERLGQAVDAEDYEEAARLRDRIGSIEERLRRIAPEQG